MHSLQSGVVGGAGGAPAGGAVTVLAARAAAATPAVVAPTLAAAAAAVQVQGSQPQTQQHALHHHTVNIAGQQVINYSKASGISTLGSVVGVVGGAEPGTLQYAGAAIQRHKVPMGNQSPGAPVQVSISQASSGGAQVVAAGAVGGPQGPNSQFQRLKVEDALYYLDQVKYKFNNQPQVYNDFLDIMKEFKSQSIDTPGVITRVSNLFKNHPELIVGFNTFLPPGYKIEVQANDQGYAFQVSVSVPSPTSCAITGPQHVVHTTHPSHPTHPSHAPHTHTQSHVVQILPQGPVTGSGAIVHNLSVGASATVQSAPPSVAPPPPPTVTMGVGNTLHNLSAAHHQLEHSQPHPHQPLPTHQHNASTQPSGQPVEFNHAIEYVNKIKNRFSRQPDKYKKFLEILHGYQRCQRELKEPQVKQTEQEVYAQVAKLFENQEDLLAEFGQFLPDATGSAASAGVRAPPSPALGAAAPVALPVLPAVSAVGIASLVAVPGVPPGRDGRPSITTIQRPALVEQTVPTPETSPADGYGGSIPPVSVNASAETHHNQNRRRALTPPPFDFQIGQHVVHKRSPSLSMPTGPPSKKARPLAAPISVTSPALPTPPHYAPRDVSFAEAAKYGSISDFGFFDRVRKALRNQEVYDNFLRCLLLYTSEIVSKTELLAVTAPFLVRHPELQRRLQDFLGVTSAQSPPPTPTPTLNATNTPSLTSAVSTPTGLSTPPTVGNGPQYLATHHQITLPGAYGVRNEPLGVAGAHYRYDRPQGDAAMEIDLSSCKRLGASYCALPRTSADAGWRRSSGRTPLCRDVLNDTWVSFPTWSEDSTFVTSRKTIYEEYIYRCEDERFELDVVIETNASCIRSLEGVAKRLSRMNGEEAARYRLDDCLGGTSATVHRRALRRIYGDKANDIIAGLKKNPVVAVPVVLRRLKAKEEEWREAQKGFNKQWREQNEKYYLKSLDHQGINFKQNDLKAIRSKSLFNEIETIYEERRKCGNEGQGGAHIVVSHGCGGPVAAAVLKDAADLLLHHARRQAAVQRAEKRRVKRLLRQFVPTLFSQPQQPLSDDDDIDDDKEGSECGNESSSPASPASPTEEIANPVNANSTIKQEKAEGSSESDSNTWEKNVRRRNSVNGSSQHNSTISKDIKRSLDSPPKMEVDNNVKKEKDERNLHEVNSTEATNGGGDDKSVTFFCGGSWYAFLRLHALLCSRLAALKDLTERLAAEEESGTPVGDAPNSASAAAALRLRPTKAPVAAERYTAMLELVRALLDGNAEPGGYEDSLREMFGIYAYPAFTLDKVVGAAVRQLQYAGTRRAADRLLSRALKEGAGARYERRARRALARHDQPAFRVKVFSGPEWKVSFELLETSEGGTATSPHNASNAVGPADGTPTTNHLLHGPGGVSQISEWSRYQEQYSIPSSRPPDGIEGCIGRKPVFLRRNIRGRSLSDLWSGCEGDETEGGSGASSGPGGVSVGGATRGPGRRKQAPRRVSHDDCSEATMDVNAYRLLYVNRMQHLLYRHGSFARAKQKLNLVREKLRVRWRRRQDAWASRNAPLAPSTLAALMPAPPNTPPPTVGR